MGLSTAKKGGIRKASNRVGPRRQMHARHPDGRPLSITLQAVLKDGTSMQRLVAVVKAHQPVKGNPVGYELLNACGNRGGGKLSGCMRIVVRWKGLPQVLDLRH